MKVACIGAGPAGLYLAIQMKLRGPKNDVTIFERNRSDGARGWGVVFWDDLVHSLSSNDPQSAREIIEHSFCWAGQVVDVKGRQPVRSEGGGFSIGRRQLLAILTQRAQELGVEIRFEHEINDISGLRDADLIVAADGDGSRLRRRYADHFKTQISVGRNKYAWLGTTNVFSDFTFGFVPTEAGWIWFHAYAFTHGLSTIIVECAPETWAGLGFGKLDSGDSLEFLKRLFEQHLDGHHLINTAAKGSGLPWLNFRSVANDKWYSDNLVLIGDAAHTTHFTIGSGTRLGIEDAIALAKALHEQVNVQEALKIYEAERQQALVLPRQDAYLSARWFENIPRYIHLGTPEFLMMMSNRRSRMMSARTYYYLYRARDWVPGLRAVYRLVTVMIRNLWRLWVHP